MPELGRTSDPRIYVSLSQLRGLREAAAGLNLRLFWQAARVTRGNQVSRIRGRGLDFEELRNYVPGDDVRAMDWRATARTGTPHVRIYGEERDRPTLLVVDQRMSMFYGSVLNLKSVTAAEAAAIAAFRTVGQSDRVGGIVFNDTECVEFVPTRSSRNIFAFLNGICELNHQLHADRLVTRSSATLNRALGTVAKVAHHDHTVIVFSDFAEIDHATHRHLSRIAQHNNLILVLIFDPSARSKRLSERVVISNGQLQAEANFSRAPTREAIANFSSKRLDRILAWQNEISLSVIPLSAGEPTVAQLARIRGVSPAEKP